MGTWVNSEFVGVSKKDLSNYSTLCLIAFCCVLVSFILILLIPTKAQIRQFRDDREKAYLELKKARRARRAAKKRARG